MYLPFESFALSHFFIYLSIKVVCISKNAACRHQLNIQIEYMYKELIAISMPSTLMFYKNTTPCGNIFPSTNQQSQHNAGTRMKHHETNFLVNSWRKKWIIRHVMAEFTIDIKKIRCHLISDLHLHTIYCISHSTGWIREHWLKHIFKGREEVFTCTRWDIERP